MSAQKAKKADLKRSGFLASLAYGSRDIVFGGVNAVTPHWAGAVDVVAVRQQDGSIKSSPFYVRFGKFQSIIRRNQPVTIRVNGIELDFTMVLGAYGSAFFAHEQLEPMSGSEGGDDDDDGLAYQDAFASESGDLNTGAMSPVAAYESDYMAQVLQGANAGNPKDAAELAELVAAGVADPEEPTMTCTTQSADVGLLVQRHNSSGSLGGAPVMPHAHSTPVLMGRHSSSLPMPGGGSLDHASAAQACIDAPRLSRGPGGADPDAWKRVNRSYLGDALERKAAAAPRTPPPNAAAAKPARGATPASSTELPRAVQLRDNDAPVAECLAQAPEAECATWTNGEATSAGVRAASVALCEAATALAEDVTRRSGSTASRGSPDAVAVTAAELGTETGGIVDAPDDARRPEGIEEAYEVEKMAPASTAGPAPTADASSLSSLRRKGSGRYTRTTGFRPSVHAAPRTSAEDASGSQTDAAPRVSLLSTQSLQTARESNGSVLTHVTAPERTLNHFVSARSQAATESEDGYLRASSPVAAAVGAAEFWPGSDYEGGGDGMLRGGSPGASDDAIEGASGGETPFSSSPEARRMTLGSRAMQQGDLEAAAAAGATTDLGDVGFSGEQDLTLGSSNDGADEEPSLLALSLCGHRLRPELPPAAVADAFSEYEVGEADFSADLLKHPDLAVRIGRRVYRYRAALPLLVAMAVYGGGEAWRGLVPTEGFDTLLASSRGAAARRDFERFDSSKLTGSGAGGIGTTPQERNESSKRTWWASMFWGAGTTQTAKKAGPQKQRPPRPRRSASKRDKKASVEADALTRLGSGAGSALGSEYAGSGSGSGLYGGSSGSIPQAGGAGWPRRMKLVKVKSTHPSPEQLHQMVERLQPGQNTIQFIVGGQKVQSFMYLFEWNIRLIVSDIDGTITRSDVLGHVLPPLGLDWSHAGITRLFSNIASNGYQFMFLSSRSIAQSGITRDFLVSLRQKDHIMPLGPVIISPHGIIPSLYREMILKRPHEFKIAALQGIRSLFPDDWNPFYSGFGNRNTDDISYLEVGIAPHRIFTINPQGKVKQYISKAANSDHVFDTLSKIDGQVDMIFPVTETARRRLAQQHSLSSMPSLKGTSAADLSLNPSQQGQLASPREFDGAAVDGDAVRENSAGSNGAARASTAAARLASAASVPSIDVDEREEFNDTKFWRHSFVDGLDIPPPPPHGRIQPVRATDLERTHR